MCIRDRYLRGHMTYIWRKQFLLDKSLGYPAGISQNEDFCFLVLALLSANIAYVNLSFRFYLYRERLYSCLLYTSPRTYQYYSG